MLVNGNEVTVKRGVVGYGEAQAVFGIEAVLFVFCPCMRVVPLEDRARYVKRTDIGRDLNAPVRFRGEDEVCERLPQHDGDNYTKLPPNAGEDSRKKSESSRRFGTRVCQIS